MTQTIESLVHARRKLSGGGQVVVLNTGAVITAEAEAMLQALHSRSLGGIDAHLVALAKKGAENFMASFYVGYGHKSIGDCGSITLFIEGVSLLAAKAIQDSALYNGQESSTRYIDFASQPFMNPAATSESHQLLESLRAFHLHGLEVMRSELAQRHPRAKNEDEKIWQKAINARAFDVMRSFLPAGAATNLAWHTELRQVADHLLKLRHHPLAEVRDIAEVIDSVVREVYPSSFSHKRYDATEEYVELAMGSYYHNPAACPESPTILIRGVDTALLATHAKLLKALPPKTELPKWIAESGQITFEFLLDFGSFRDLQRHRAVSQRMPLLTTRFGFAKWYFDQMSEDLQEEAKAFLAGCERQLAEIKTDSCSLQYYIPIGYNVPCRLGGDIPALTYLVELRSSSTVHATLRIIAQQMGKVLMRELASTGYLVHIDDSPDRFSYKRGTHDIVEKV